MEFFQTIWIAIGAAVAALIAAMVTFVSAITSKEQKTSEFRQEWIDRTRDEISRYLTLLVTLKPVQKTEDEKILYRELLGKYHQIKIRMNPNPKKDVEIKRLIDESFNDFHAIDARNRLLAERRLQILKESQLFFKAEWEIVKKGEKIFRLSKWAPLVLVVLTGALVWFGLSIGVKPVTDGATDPVSETNIQKSPNQAIQPTPKPLRGSGAADG